MELRLAAELVGIGLIGGFMAGFLGVGGGVIIIPLLLYVVGLPMKLTTGISMVQAFFATLSGLIAHRRSRTVDYRLGTILGTTGIAGSLAGSLGSSLVAERALLVIYLLLVILSLILMFFAPSRQRLSPREVNRWVAGVTGLVVGALAGMLGVGGGFVLLPIMISVLKIPVRVAVGTSLMVILMVTLAGAGGKIATGQFDAGMGLAIIAGSIVGAQIGGRLSSRVSSRVIRASLMLLLVVILIRTSIDLFGK